MYSRLSASATSVELHIVTLARDYKVLLLWLHELPLYLIKAYTSVASEQFCFSITEKHIGYDNHMRGYDNHIRADSTNFQMILSHSAI